LRYNLPAFRGKTVATRNICFAPRHSCMLPVPQSSPPPQGIPP
jgi:hypothetical protein